jgi:hypothetical protein
MLNIAGAAMLWFNRGLGLEELFSRVPELLAAKHISIGDDTFVPSALTEALAE